MKMVGSRVVKTWGLMVDLHDGEEEHFTIDSQSWIPHEQKIEFQVSV